MITFARVTQTYDESTDRMTSVTTSVTGSGTQIKGDPHIYKALGLRLWEAPTLLFGATTYGDVPAPGDTVTWPATGGSVYTVRDVQPIAPDGVVIGAHVVIAK